MTNAMKDWLLRFIKGMFIGSGFILPGVSGGALAAIFGIYERIISFLAHITRNFKENVLFFIPVGLGGLFGMFILSFGVSFALGNYQTIVLWFFVGCILGTAPALWKEAGKNGRTNRDIIIMAVTFVAAVIFLYVIEDSIGGSLTPSFLNWVMSGALIALGVIVPGLSPSNFLAFFGLYKPMSDGIKTLDFSVLIPLAIGGVICLLSLSKIMDAIFQRAYPQMFHFILGVVFASTIMIIPANFSVDYAGFGWLQYLWCVISCVAGAALGKWMSRLEETYK
ncbi:DUF368 domain-containing protein [Vagococcus elongatus]|uniref:DUF368 domain-containing protein n=1 Tax=Vagococcus elongatus TaxID=180344 RepID=A0A430B1F0_9ENTE|nr:DUF368 domain-containing protein [Vagococcus elongatus]RSU14052.1 DUF368 domain-containing protein [Vagococcus elongatus]